MSTPPFPFRRPGQPYAAYLNGVSRYLANPSVQMAAYRNAVNSGHGDDWRDLDPDGKPLTWWRDTLSGAALVARRVRSYLSWRLAGPSAAPEPPRGADSDLDDVLLAAVNALDVAQSADLALTLRGPGLGLVLAGLREHGTAVLATHPGLGVVIPGPPVAVALDDGDAPSGTPTEVERLAPGTAPGSPEQIDALVEAALRGEDLSRLPHHLLAAVRGALLERALEMAVAARLPAALDPDADPENLLANLLLSPETQAAAAMLRAALGGISVVLTPTGGYGNG